MFNLNREEAQKLTQDSDSTMSEIPLDAIRESDQVRQEYEDADQSLQELADSIAAQGVIQPVTIRPHPDGHGYEMVAGGRRFRASRMAGLKSIPAIIRHLSDAAAHDMQMAENIHRKNLTQIEEARRIRQDLRELEGDVSALLARYKKGESWLHKRLSLLDLGPQAARLIEDRISADIEVIYGVRSLERKHPEAAKKLVDEIAADGNQGSRRGMVKEARERVATEGREKGKKRPFRARPAKMPTPTRKTQPLHSYYQLVVDKKMSGEDALNSLPQPDRDAVLAAVDNAFNEGRAADDPEARLVELLRAGRLAGAGGLLVVAYLDGCRTTVDRTPQEIVARIGPMEGPGHAG